MEHGSAETCIGLSINEIMFFLTKKHLQVPSADEMNVIVQKLIDVGHVSENITDHFKYM